MSEIIIFPGQPLAIKSDHKPEGFAHLGQRHPAQYLLSAKWPPAAPPAQQVCLQFHLSPQPQAGSLHSPQIPGWKIPGSLFASSPRPHPAISFQPQVRLSPHCHQDNIHKMSPPPLPGSQALGTFPYLTTLLLPTACRPTAPSCTCRWGPCTSACFPYLCPPSSPVQKALPLLFADLSSAIIGGLVQGTTFTPLPATPEAFSVDPAALSSLPGEGLPELGQTVWDLPGPLQGAPRSLPWVARSSPPSRLSLCSLLCPHGAWPTPWWDPAILPPCLPAPMLIAIFWTL